MNIEYSNLKMITRMMKEDNDFFLEILKEVKKNDPINGELYAEKPLSLFLSHKNQIELCCETFGDPELFYSLIEMDIEGLIPLNQERINLYFNNIFTDDSERESFIESLIKQDYAKYKELIFETISTYEIDFIVLRNINPIEILKDKKLLDNYNIEYTDILFENIVAWEEKRGIKTKKEEEQALYIDYIKDLSTWGMAKLKDGLDCLFIYQLLSAESVIKLIKDNIINKDILNECIQVKKQFFYSENEENYKDIDEDFILDYIGFIKGPRFFYIMHDIKNLNDKDRYYVFNDLGLDFSLQNIGNDLFFSNMPAKDLTIISNNLNKKDFMLENGLGENLVDSFFYNNANNDNECVRTVIKNYIKNGGDIFEEERHGESFFNHMFDQYPLVIYDFLKNKELNLNSKDVYNAFENLKAEQKIKLTSKKDFIYKSLNKLLIDFEKNTITKVIKDNSNVPSKNTKRL